MYTGKEQVTLPTAEDRLPLVGAGGGAAALGVRVPSSSVARKEEVRLSTRASFTALSVAGGDKPSGGIYDMIPKCCVMS